MLKLLFRLAIFLILHRKSTQQGEQKEVAKVKCYRPETLSIYTKELPAMCIYGIKITDGFDFSIYYNDPERDASMAEKLDNIGMDLCQYVRLTGATASDPFQEVVVPINDKHLIDMFITCCNECERDEENWRIYLKSQFLAHRYSIIETISKYHSYELTGRLRKLNFPAICITEDYREIPVTGNNNVCYTYGKQNFINPLAGEKYPSVFKNLLKMGQYNATIAVKYSLGEYCDMNYAHLASVVESCSFGLFQHNFEYFCCCYGIILRDCQKTAALLFRKNEAKHNHLFCLFHKEKIEIDGNKEGKKSITFKMTVGTMLHIMEELNDYGYCYMHLKPDNNIKFGIDESLCIKSGLLDIRLRPIIRTYCFSTSDYDDYCPFITPDTNKTHDILCCCNHQHFCNYNPDIYTKLANQNATRPKCFYNDRYQYLFNQYYVNSTHNDVCLLHFIDSNTINDISTTSSKNGSIFHLYPGNGFYPIDFSYTFLENNTCTYVEVEISTATIKRSVDCFNEKFNTNYMPLKVFVCSCSLRKDGNHCDQKLETEIANRAERFPNESLTKCIKYEAKGAEVKRNELVYVRHTSYCFVEASIIIDLKYGVKVLVRGNGVTRQVAEASKRNFNHIAFSMYNLSGTETQFCKTYLTDEVFPVGVCFCRTYDISAPACNSDPKMISMAKRMLIIEATNHYSRFVYLHKLNTAGNLWCLSSPFYAKIIFDGKTDKFYRNSKCVTEQTELLKIERTHRPKLFDNSIFCDSISFLADKFGCFDLNWNEEKELQISQGSNVFCCCKNENDCDTTSYQIQHLIFHLRKTLNL